MVVGKGSNRQIAQTYCSSFIANAIILYCYWDIQSLEYWRDQKSWSGAIQGHLTWRDLVEQVFSNSAKSVCHFTLTLVTEQQLLQQQHFRKCQTDEERCAVVFEYHQVPQLHNEAALLVSVCWVSRNHGLQDEAAVLVSVCWVSRNHELCQQLNLW